MSDAVSGPSHDGADEPTDHLQRLRAATAQLLASVLSRLPDTYRGNRRARGFGDPGHRVLEGVLVVSAGITMVVFGIWFLFFAGAAPAPIGLQL